MLDTLELHKPILPRHRCRIHEPEPIDSRFVRRADLPCPECWATNPATKTPKTYVKLLKRPIAETGKGGVGLKVTIETRARATYEACTMGSKLVWRMTELQQV